MSKTKITVKIESHLVAAFNKKIDSLFIKRDALISHILDYEVDQLERELAGFRQSNAAKKYISHSLGRMHLSKVNISIDKNVALKLKRVTSDANMVRDAFINRLYLLLICSNEFLHTFNLPQFSEDIGGKMEAPPISPLNEIRTVMNDPFYYLRGEIDQKYGCGIYGFRINGFPGFVCFMSDIEIPDDLIKDQEVEGVSTGVLMEI